MTYTKLNIALIDDHQMLSHSLASLLSNYSFINDIKVFSSAQEFLDESAGNMPDVIISDVAMPGMSGLDLLIYIRENNIKTKVIILSSITEIQTIRYALTNGVVGYLSKDASADELADAIQAVDTGDEPYIGESLRKSLLRNTLAEERFIYNLSPREKEVLNWVCAGKTIKETAYLMELSTNTVQTYYKTILKKFNLNRTADLIVFAMQNGLYIPNNKG